MIPVNSSVPCLARGYNPGLNGDAKEQIKLKLKARVNRSDAATIQHALEQLSSKGSIRKAGDEFVVEAEMGRSRELRLSLANVHTPTMILKNAALLALIGTILMTVLLVWNFVFNFLNLLRGLVPAVTLFSSFIYAFGCFCVMVFFFVFHRTQA